MSPRPPAQEVVDRIVANYRAAKGETPQLATPDNRPDQGGTRSKVERQVDAILANYRGNGGRFVPPGRA